MEELHIVKIFPWTICKDRDGSKNMKRLGKRVLDELPHECFDEDIYVRVEDGNPTVSVGLEYHMLSPPIKRVK